METQMLKGIVIVVGFTILFGWLGHEVNVSQSDNPMFNGQVANQVSNARNVLQGDTFEQAITNN